MDEIDFRLRTYMPCTKQTCGDKLLPGMRITSQVGRLVSQDRTLASIGCFVRHVTTGDVYALSIGHVFKDGDLAYDGERVIGQCVEIVNSERPISMDLAIIRLNAGSDINNTIPASTGERCSLRFPHNKQEVLNKLMYKCQRKSDGNYRYCYFRYDNYTNKELGIHRARACVKTANGQSVLERGDCGSLLTTLPQSCGHVIVLGMLSAVVSQEAEDGGETLEYSVAYQLQHALEQSKTFRGQMYEFCDRRQ